MPELTTQEALKQKIEEFYQPHPEAKKVLLAMLEKTEGLTKSVLVYFGHNRPDSVGGDINNYTTSLANFLYHNHKNANFSVHGFCVAEIEGMGDTYLGHGVWMTPGKQMHVCPLPEELEHTEILAIEEPAPPAARPTVKVTHVPLSQFAPAP